VEILWNAMAWIGLFSTVVYLATAGLIAVVSYLMENGGDPLSTRLNRSAVRSEDSLLIRIRKRSWSAGLSLGLGLFWPLLGLAVVFFTLLPSDITEAVAQESGEPG